MILLADSEGINLLERTGRCLLCPPKLSDTFSKGATEVVRILCMYVIS